MRLSFKNQMRVIKAFQFINHPATIICLIWIALLAGWIFYANGFFWIALGFFASAVIDFVRLLWRATRR